MPKDLVDEMSPRDSVDLHKLKEADIDAFRKARWRCRTDLLYLAKNVLGYDRVSREFNGPLIDFVEQFPRPTQAQFYEHDKFTSKGWEYSPILKNVAFLPGKKRRLILDFRSSFKTSLNCECHTVQWLLNFPQICIAIFQYKLAKAQAIVKAIKDPFIFNKKFRSLFPDLCPPPGVYELGTLDKFSIHDVKRWRTNPRREDSVMAAALEAGLAGYHFEVMKFSDVVDTENSETEEQCLKTVHKFGQSEFLLVDQATNFITVEGTRYHFRDLGGHLLEIYKKELEYYNGDKSKTSWAVYCRGVFKVRKNDADMHFSPEELELPPILNEKGKRITWDVPDEPKRFPIEGMELKEQIDPANFSAQMLNKPFSGRGGIPDFVLRIDPVTSEKVPPGITPAEVYRRIPMAYTVISVDPAETATERSNYTAMVVATCDRHGRFYIIDIIHGKWNPSDVSTKILEACDKYKPEYLCVEEVSATRNLMPGIKREWDLFSWKHWIPTVKFNKRDAKLKKEEKIRLALHTPFHNHDLRFVRELIPQSSWYHLIRELDQFPKGGQDDILDAMSELYTARDWFGQEYAKVNQIGLKDIRLQPNPEIVREAMEAAFTHMLNGFDESRSPQHSDIFIPKPKLYDGFGRKLGGL